jgi:hypothetical protein
MCACAATVGSQDRFILATEGGVGMAQISVVDNAIMSLPGLRGLVLRGAAQHASTHARYWVPVGRRCAALVAPRWAMHAIHVDALVGREVARAAAFNARCNFAGDGEARRSRPLFMFGDTYDMRKQLRITNRLTTYMFLLDSKRRVRPLQLLASAARAPRRLPLHGPSQGSYLRSLTKHVPRPALDQL